MAADPSLLPASAADAVTAVRFPDGELSYGRLRAAAFATAAELAGARRIAVWAEPCLETCVGVVAALAAGAAVVPLNPKLAPRELAHVVTDSAPDALLAPAGRDLPELPGSVPRLAAALDAEAGGPPDAEPTADAPALVLYTSGTTGPPKGVVLSQRALTSNLDALAEAWAWTADDVLVHALPLFHAHGLVLGVLGPLRLGGRLHHVGRFSVGAVASELAGEATMLFAVPTMYHRLAEAAERDAAVATALGRARLLVSGSAALAVRDHRRIEAATGQRIAERYGLTETLMNCAARADGRRTAGTVGPPLAGVEVRLVDEHGSVVDGDAIGEIQVRGPNLFTEYLNRADETAAAIAEGGWFRTDDVATRTAGGQFRIIGRRSTDLIKTGGYRVGAGEIEEALAEHPGVAEAAVKGEPDEDLGQRIVAWVREPGAAVTVPELAEHVAARLTPHKHPRAVHFVERLPRNALGKLLKAQLRAPASHQGQALRIGDAVPNLASNAFLAAGSIVIGDVRIGARTSVWYGAILRADTESISIGDDCNLQDGCVLHSDPGDPVVLGDRVTVGHRAIVHGAHVEADSLVGMGAIVLNGARVGTGSLIAAGAVVRPGEVIPPRSLVAGVPAKIRRQVSEEERADIADTAAEYVALARRHQADATDDWK